MMMMTMITAGWQGCQIFHAGCVQLVYEGSVVSLRVDSPQIVCHSAEAEVGDRNVCVRCDIKSKPTATTVFWIVADNGSSVLAGQVTDDYWVVIKVYFTIYAKQTKFHEINCLV